MEKILVSDIMTRNPATIKPETSLLECAKIMVRKKVGSLVIIGAKKKLLGFISRRDILWALIKRPKEDLRKIKAIEISPKKIATIKSDATIRETINKIKEMKFERLPVVKNGELVGIITIRDILNFHPEIYPEIGEFSKIKEETEKLKRLKEREFSRHESRCEKCGKTSALQKFNGMLLCETCINVL